MPNALIPKSAGDQPLLIQQESIEHEIKLAPSEELQAKLEDSIGSARSEERIAGLIALLNLGDYSSTSLGTEMLLDEYFDTDDLDVAKIHGSIRIRRSHGDAELTFKKSLGTDIGELHRREYTMKLTYDQFVFHRRSGFAFLASALIPDIKGALKPMLSVTNERQSFSLERGDAKFVLSLDNYFYSDTKHLRKGPFFEIEIEAKNDAAMERLSDLRRGIAKTFSDLTYATESKYERGLKLFGVTFPTYRRMFLQGMQAEPIGIAGVLLAIIGIIISILR